MGTVDSENCIKIVYRIQRSKKEEKWEEDEKGSGKREEEKMMRVDFHNNFSLHSYTK